MSGLVHARLPVRTTLASLHRPYGGMLGRQPRLAHELTAGPTLCQVTCLNEQDLTQRGQTAWR